VVISQFPLQSDEIAITRGANLWGVIAQTEFALPGTTDAGQSGDCPL